MRRAARAALRALVDGGRRRIVVEPEDAHPIFVPSGAGTVLEFLSVTHKLTSGQTGGACYLFESEFAAGVGNRLHVHRREDEIGYVLEGALEVRFGEQRHVLDAGGLARLPKHVPHAIRNPLETPSRYLFMCVPGGLDRWFDELAKAKDDGVLDDALHRRLALDYGLEWLE